MATTGSDSPYLQPLFSRPRSDLYIFGAGGSPRELGDIPRALGKVLSPGQGTPVGVPQNTWPGRHSGPLVPTDSRTRCQWVMVKAQSKYYCAYLSQKKVLALFCKVFVYLFSVTACDRARAAQGVLISQGWVHWPSLTECHNFLSCWILQLSAPKHLNPGLFPHARVAVGMPGTRRMRYKS